MRATTRLNPEAPQALHVRMRRPASADRPLQDRIVFKVAGGAEIIDPRAVLYLKADSNYCEIHMADGRTVVVSRTLKQCAQLFPPAFIRPHQSYLINPKFLERYRSKEHYLRLQGDLRIPVSRAGKAVVTALLEGKK